MSETKYQRGAFHVHHGLTFRRVEDGSVVVGWSDGSTLTVDDSSWASVVASVSARRENGETYREALWFHNEPTEAPEAEVSPDLRRRLIEAAERPIKARRAILLLAAHATGGHLPHPHGESCEVCREHWPCVTVRRAAGPALNAVAASDAALAAPSPAALDRTGASE